MAKWSDWLPDLAALLPACPSITMEHELRNAAITFFEDSRAWKSMLDPIRVVAGQPDIDIEPSDGNQEAVVRIEAGWFDSKPIKAISADELDVSFNDDWTVHTGSPSHFVTLMNGQTRLYPSPNMAGTLKLRASLRPADEATRLPDGLMKYRKDIGQGALAQLRLYPNQPWSDPALAAVNQSAFRAAIDKLNLRASRSFGRARIPSRTRWC